MFNVTISNVPGPERALYFRGARLEAAFPVSLVTHGQALNITCQSYAGTLAFGFTGCRDTLPHMQRIATYTGEALAELELAVTHEPPAKRAARRPAAAPAAKKKAAGRTPAAPARPAAVKSPAKGKAAAKAQARPSRKRSV